MSVGMTVLPPYYTSSAHFLSMPPTQKKKKNLEKQDIILGGLPLYRRTSSGSSAEAYSLWCTCRLLHYRQHSPRFLEARHLLHLAICACLHNGVVPPGDGYNSHWQSSQNSRIFTNTAVRFDVHMSVHRKYISKVQPIRCNNFSIYLFLKIALHVSGGSSAHHQEHKTVHTASGIVKPILLPAAIVDSSRQQYWFDNIWCYMYSFMLLMMGRGTAWNM